MAVGLVLNRRRQVPAEDTPAFGAIAERFRRGGDLERAVALCEEGLQKFPDHMSARVTLGWALLDLGRYAQAQNALEQVLKRAPDNLAAIRGLAELHQRAESTVELSLEGPGPWPPDPAAIEAAAGRTVEPALDEDLTLSAELTPAAGIPADVVMTPAAFLMDEPSAEVEVAVLNPEPAVELDLTLLQLTDTPETASAVAVAEMSPAIVDAVVDEFIPAPAEPVAAVATEAETADLIAALDSPDEPVLLSEGALEIDPEIIADPLLGSVDLGSWTHPASDPAVEAVVDPAVEAFADSFAEQLIEPVPSRVGEPVAPAPVALAPVPLAPVPLEVSETDAFEVPPVTELAAVEPPPAAALSIAPLDVEASEPTLVDVPSDPIVIDLVAADFEPFIAAEPEDPNPFVLTDTPWDLASDDADLAGAALASVETAERAIDNLALDFDAPLPVPEPEPEPVLVQVAAPAPTLVEVRLAPVEVVEPPAPMPVPEPVHAITFVDYSGAPVVDVSLATPEHASIPTLETKKGHKRAQRRAEPRSVVLLEGMLRGIAARRSQVAAQYNLPG